MLVYPWAPKDKARCRVGAGSGAKRHSWCDWEIWFLHKQRNKPIEQTGTYIEETESPVGEGSYIWEEGGSCKEH